MEFSVSLKKTGAAHFYATPDVVVRIQVLVQ